MTFLETLTDLPDPTGSDPLSSSSGKQQTAYVKDVTDAVEDIRGVLAGPIWRSVEAFPTVPTAVLDSADAATNWVGVGLTPTVDTAVKTTGSGSIKLGLRSDQTTTKGYVNVPGTPTTAPGGVSKVRLVFALRWEDDDSRITPPECWEFFISTAANVGGAVTAFPIPYLTPGSWVTLTLSVSGIATLGSFGIRHKGAAFVVAGSTPTLNIWLDQVRWEATELDVALASAQAVVIPADYVSAVPQNTIMLPAGKTVLDLRSGSASLSRVGNVVYATAFGLYPNTGADITGLLSYIIGIVPHGWTLVIAPGQYVFNGRLELHDLTDISISGFGASFYRTVESSPDPMFVNRSAQRINLRGFSLFGFHTVTTLGSALTSVASNRLSAQQSSKEDVTVTAEATAWTAISVPSSVGNNTKVAKTPRGSAFEIHYHANPWSAATAYNPGAYVSSAGVAYVCILGNTNQAPPNATFWAVATAQTIGMTLPIGASCIVDVEPSTSYTVVGNFRPIDQPQAYTPWMARTCEIVLKWYTAAGAVAATASNTFSVVETDEKTWVTATGAATSPADAAKASIECHILAAAPPAGAPTGGEAHVIDEIDFHRTTARTLATVGTTRSMTNPGDEVKVPTARVYARDKDLQIKCDFVLSAVSPVASDCELIARDEETGEVLVSRILTTPLNATPSTHQLVYTISNSLDQRDDLARLIRFSARKIHPGGTISVTSATEYGGTFYNGGTEGGNGIVVSDTDPDSNDITIEDVLAEGMAACAVKFTIGGNRCVARRVVSRACQHQGLGLTGGADNGFEDCEIYGAGRSGFDLEPPGQNRPIRRAFILNCKVFRPTNAGFAHGPWPTAEFTRVDGLFIWKQSIQSTLGGKWSTIANVISHEPLGPISQKDLQLAGLKSTFTNIIAEYGVELNNTSKNYIDDNGNLVPITSSGNVVTNVRCRTPGGGGVVIQGDNSLTPVVARGTIVAAAGTNSFGPISIPVQADATYQVALEFDWHTDGRVMSGRTTTSFTIETGVPAPVGGGTIRWTTLGV